MTMCLARRSFLQRIVGGVLAGGSLAVVAGPSRAQLATYTGVTDCDTGGGDAPGYGRGVRNQYTDSDSGQNADARCHGRGPGGAGPSGRASGAGQYGSQQPTRGCSDRDPVDPGGRGRNCAYGSGHPSSSGCTDRDSSPDHADPIGGGRYCR